MKSAFCCASLRTGSLIIGWLGLIWIVFFLVLVSLVESPYYEVHHLRHYFNSDVIEAIILVLKLLIISSYVSLIHGAYTGRPGFLIPYLVLCAIQLVYCAGTLVYTFIMLMMYSDEATLSICGILIIECSFFMAISMYAFCVVLSHYKELRSTAKKLSNLA